MHKRGYYGQEARELLELCIELNGDGVHAPLPAYDGPWTPVLEKMEIPKPFDNAWTLWKKEEEGKTSYAIVIRGTIPRDESIIEDILAESICANCCLNIGSGEFLQMQLVDQEVEDAAVHSGFAWGLAVLLFHKELGIFANREALGPGDLFITGHSQGAAIATLLHSFLSYASLSNNADYLWTRGREYKSYVFAQPKPGNWQYSMDLARLAGNSGLMHVVNNPLDWVPQVPFALEGITDITGDPVVTYLKKKHLVLSAIVSSAEAALKAIQTHISHAANRIPTERAELNEHMDKRYVTCSEQGGTGNGNLGYVPCGRVRSTSMRADLTAIAPNWQNDPLAHHHLFTYKSLL